MEIIEIKKDQQQYISEIAALESDIFPDPWSEKSIRDTLENPQARIWAIISKQAPPCSCASTAPEHASETAASCASTAPEHAGKPQLLGYVIFYYVLDEGEIARIATSPQHRRQGVAVRLLEKMRAFSYEQNITRWLLDVRISNETAIHFYKAAGFAKDGVRKNFYATTPEDAMNQLVQKEEVQELLESLNDRERQVIRLRFGLEDGKTHTLEEIGDELNVTRERVRQIEARAMEKLRSKATKL